MKKIKLSIRTSTYFKGNSPLQVFAAENLPTANSPFSPEETPCSDLAKVGIQPPFLSWE
jgi:hypothetical protein